MNAPLGPSDAALVARVLEADRDAFAQVYDRYGPRLYDFAYSMLRHREDAADAVADSFVTFAEKLPQLREPDRLRPWLYAIVRSECLRRLKARKRVSYGDDEQLIAMADDAITPEQSAEQAALTQLVWDAAAGLADRDRALLDLHLRQGLEGAELGEAMGVSAANAYVMLNRLRAQVDKSLGALLIARLGRDDCDELDTLLVDWDGTFSPLIRKRVARHVENCEICGERRKKIVSPWMLLAGVPMFAAPAALRDRVVNDTQLVAYSGAAAAAGGPASGGTTAPAGGGRFLTRTRAAAAAAVFVAAAGVTTVVVWPDDPTPTTSAVPGESTSLDPTDGPITPTATQAPSPEVSPTASTTTSADPSATPSSSDLPTVEATLADASLTLSSRTIALGTTREAASVRIGNHGEVPLFYFATTETPWLTVSPARDTVPGGASSTLSVRANRGQVREGSATGVVRIRWNGGSTTVRVSIRQENDPTVESVTADGRPVCGDNTVRVAAIVRDESRLKSVTLHWADPDPVNTKHTRAMTRSGSRWVAQMGPVTIGGDVDFYVVATDRFGNTTRSDTVTVGASPCPQ